MIKKGKLKVLILGGDGMLGHMFLKKFKKEHEVLATVRRQQPDTSKLYQENISDYIYNVDATNYISIEKSFQLFSPDFVINCIGLTKSLCVKKDTANAIYLNALFPHMLLKTCKKYDVKLVQFSSDCIFSGDDGAYEEASVPDSKDLYGLSKTLGEVNSSQCLTIRKSTIGLERYTSHGLIEWFLDATGTIKGYTNALYSGITSSELVRVVDFVICRKSFLSGIVNIASEPISKYSLLKRLSILLERDDIKIEEDSSFKCDRSLNGNKFESITGYKVPSWDNMLYELAEEIKRR